MEYQIERLHIIGDERPYTGLKNKVKRKNFKENLNIIDPITFEETKQPLKTFMVTQLQIAFERENMMLSPFDEVLHKQLVDYAVERVGQNGNPIFVSENEHFVDALGLAYLAMVLEFKELTNMIKDAKTSTKISITSRTLGGASLNKAFEEVENSSLNYQGAQFKVDTSDKRGDRQSAFRVGANYRRGFGSTAWGSRCSSRRSLRSSNIRNSW